MESGFPMPLDSQFPGVGNKVDAAYLHENGMWCTITLRQTREIRHDGAHRMYESIFVNY